MVIGVTGQYCSGKNVVSDILKKHGFTEINVDKIGHQVLENETKRVIQSFGREILDKTGKISRKKLAEIIFRSKKYRKRLETILHPPMKAHVQSVIKKNNKNFVINAALLFQMQLNTLCDFVIFLSAPFCSRMLRARRRDNLSVLAVLRRFFVQAQIFSKLKLPRVDIYYECNKGSILELKKRITEILERRNRGEE